MRTHVVILEMLRRLGEAAQSGQEPEVPDGLRDKVIAIVEGAFCDENASFGLALIVRSVCGFVRESNGLSETDRGQILAGKWSAIDNRKLAAILLAPEAIDDLVDLDCVSEGSYWDLRINRELEFG